jgi:hypothetical protein
MARREYVNELTKKMEKKKPFHKLEKNYAKYREELERLEKKYSGRLNPHDIVREASNTNNPLHNWFDWTDETASEKWRVHQARLLLNSIKIRVQFENGFKEYKKYLNVTFVSTTDNKKTKNFYMDSKAVMNDEGLRNQVITKAVKEAEYWQRAYNDYQELEDIFSSIRRTKKKLAKKKILVTATH